MNTITMKMHTHLVVEGGDAAVEAVDRAGEGEEVDVEMGTMIMLMAAGRMITPLHIWAMDIPAEEVVVSGAVAGEVAMGASLNTNKMETITTRHLFLLQPEDAGEVVGEANPEAEGVVAMQTA